MAAGRNLEGAAGSIAPSCATPGMEAQGAAARGAAAQGAAACATQPTRAPEYAHATCNLTTAPGAPGIATATPAIAAGMRTIAARGSAGLAPGGATQGTAEVGMESHGTAVPSTPGVSHGRANPAHGTELPAQERARGAHVGRLGLWGGEGEASEATGTAVEVLGSARRDSAPAATRHAGVCRCACRKSLGSFTWHGMDHRAHLHPERRRHGPQRLSDAEGEHAARRGGEAGEARYLGRRLVAQDHHLRPWRPHRLVDDPVRWP